MESNIEIKTADRSNFIEFSLDSFDRFQEVVNVYRMENGKLVLKNNPFTETWSPERKREKAAEILSGKYITYCVFDGDTVVGEIMLIPELNEGRMIIDSFHVSRDYRRRGIGRQLIEAVTDYAKSRGAKALYASCCSAEETVAFYMAMGFRPSTYPIPSFVKDEPFDIQMELQFDCAGTKASKELSEMTIEELWELFPIFLVEPREQWKDDYAGIESELQIILSDCHSPRISHIGSTAISGIWAKNIVDVLVEIPMNGSIEKAAEMMEQNGFIIMSADTSRISLNKGYTKEGFADKVYHIHLRYVGDNDELYFRDYLNEHPDAAKEYEALKFSLWKKHEDNRDAYTDAKTEFIRRWTQEARKQYGNRYC